MGINIQINLELSATQKRVVRAIVITAVAFGAAGIGLAMASPHQFDAGETLQAADLNGLNVARTDAGSYSVSATLYCGATSQSASGDLSGLTASGLGYARAKHACEAVAGCGVTAHMCTSEEVVRSGALGLNVPAPGGWYSTGSDAVTSTQHNNDCNGWTSSVGTSFSGMTWQGNGANGAAIATSCGSANPILCCD